MDLNKFFEEIQKLKMQKFPIKDNNLRDLAGYFKDLDGAKNIFTDGPQGKMDELVSLATNRNGKMFIDALKAVQVSSGGFAKNFLRALFNNKIGLLLEFKRKLGRSELVLMLDLQEAEIREHEAKKAQKNRELALQERQRRYEAEMKAELEKPRLRFYNILAQEIFKYDKIRNITRECSDALFPFLEVFFSDHTLDSMLSKFCDLNRNIDFYECLKKYTDTTIFYNRRETSIPEFVLRFLFAEKIAPLTIDEPATWTSSLFHYALGQIFVMPSENEALLIIEQLLSKVSRYLDSSSSFHSKLDDFKHKLDDFKQRYIPFILDLYRRGWFCALVLPFTAENSKKLCQLAQDIKFLIYLEANEMRARYLFAIHAITEKDCVGRNSLNFSPTLLRLRKTPLVKYCDISPFFDKSYYDALKEYALEGSYLFSLEEFCYLVKETLVRENGSEGQVVSDAMLNAFADDLWRTRFPFLFTLQFEKFLFSPFLTIDEEPFLTCLDKHPIVVACFVKAFMKNASKEALAQIEKTPLKKFMDYKLQTEAGVPTSQKDKDNVQHLPQLAPAEEERKQAMSPCQPMSVVSKPTPTSTPVSMTAHASLSIFQPGSASELEEEKPTPSRNKQFAILMFEKAPFPGDASNAKKKNILITEINNHRYKLRLEWHDSFTSCHQDLKRFCVPRSTHIAHFSEDLDKHEAWVLIEEITYFYFIDIYTNSMGQSQLLFNPPITICLDKSKSDQIEQKLKEFFNQDVGSIIFSFLRGLPPYPLVENENNPEEKATMRFHT